MNIKDSVSPNSLQMNLEQRKCNNGLSGNVSLHESNLREINFAAESSERKARRETFTGTLAKEHKLNGKTPLTTDKNTLDENDVDGISPPANMKRRMTSSCIVSDAICRLRHNRDASNERRPRALSRSNSFHAAREFPPQLNIADFEEREIVGEGAFGRVVKLLHKSSGRLYVMKEVLEHNADNEESVLREVSLLRSLEHPNLLSCVGVIFKDRCVCLISEFIDGGSLHEIVLDLNRPISWVCRTAYARDIAAGLTYLHENSIVHRDLTSHNCLVRKTNSVVVADFGLSKILDHRAPVSPLTTQDHPATNGADTPGTDPLPHGRKKRDTVVGHPYWMAPEMMAGRPYTRAVDVYSFGIVLCELLARVDADPDQLPRNPRTMAVDLTSVQEDLLPSDCPHPLALLSMRCCALLPEARPEFSDCLSYLESVFFHLETGSSIPKELTI